MRKRLKQPYNALPWSREQISASKAHIKDEQGIVVAVTDDGWNTNYIVKACNNFPQAIELLEKVYWKYRSDELTDEIDQFLQQHLK